MVNICLNMAAPYWLIFLLSIITTTRSLEAVKRRSKYSSYLCGSRYHRYTLILLGFINQKIRIRCTDLCCTKMNQQMSIFQPNFKYRNLLFWRCHMLCVREILRNFRYWKFHRTENIRKMKKWKMRQTVSEQLQHIILFNNMQLWCLMYATE